MEKGIHEKINEYINTWEKRCYKNGLPDKAPVGLENSVPSYERIAIAILKNDHNLKSLGYKPNNSIYYSILKRIEIESRIKKEGHQLKLF